MRFSPQTKCFYPDKIKYATLPDDIIPVSDDDFNRAMGREPGEDFDFINGELVIIPKSLETFIIEKKAAIKRLRDNAIVQPVTSAALGVDHVYSTVPENRQFLNDLITLGNGGKFTCTDTAGVKARRLHTHAQLLSLAGTIEAHISAQFDHYETKLAEIAAATTQAELDAVVW